jgi:hypothetical protein
VNTRIEGMRRWLVALQGAGTVVKRSVEKTVQVKTSTCALQKGNGRWERNRVTAQTYHTLESSSICTVRCYQLQHVVDFGVRRLTRPDGRETNKSSSAGGIVSTSLCAPGDGLVLNVITVRLRSKHGMFDTALPPKNSRCAAPRACIAHGRDRPCTLLVFLFRTALYCTPRYNGFRRRDTVHKTGKYCGKKKSLLPLRLLCSWLLRCKLCPYSAGKIPFRLKPPT